MLYKDGLHLRMRNRMGVWIPGLALAAVACFTQTLGAQVTQAANTTAPPPPLHGS